MVIIGAKLKGPDDPPAEDELLPPPKLRVGLESLVAAGLEDLEPAEEREDGELVAIVCSARGSRRKPI